MWADGAREQILRPHLDNYSRARDTGWVAEREYLQRVCNEFHARVSWRLADHEEPVLEQFDPATQIEEEELDEEEEVKQRARVQQINARIRRWFIYRIRRRHRQTAGLDPRKDPFAVLLGKLSGLSAPPKSRQAYQQFMHEAYEDVVKPAVVERWAAARAANQPETVGRKEPKAGFRAQVAREMFAQLAPSEREGFAVRAKEEGARRKQEFEAGLKGPPSNSPLDRQKCLDALPDFIAPILRGIFDYTGCHSVLLVGGPMPKFGGDLRTMHVAFGQNKTAAAAHFPQWDRERFNNHVLKFMVEYLRTAFTPADCEKAALPADLSQAKYTMPATKDDLLSSDDDDDDDDDADDLLSDDSLAPPAKKQKGVKKAPAPAKSKPAVRDDEAPAKPGKRKRASQDAPSGQSGPAVASSPAGASSPAVASPVASRAPSPPRVTTTTVDTPIGPVTFEDPTAGIAYDDLTYEQQRARNVLRNKVLGEMMRQDLRETLGPVVAKKTTPRPRPRPRRDPAQPNRRSGRLSTGGEDSTQADSAMDVDEGPHRPSPAPSPPASASEPHSPLPDNDMNLDDVVPGQDSNMSDWADELDELESSDRNSIHHRLPDDDDEDGDRRDDGDNSKGNSSKGTGGEGTGGEGTGGEGTGGEGTGGEGTGGEGTGGEGTGGEGTGGEDTGGGIQDGVKDNGGGRAGEGDGSAASESRVRADFAAAVAPPSSQPPPCPPNAQAWFAHARAQLIGVDLGPHFHAALAAWTRIEAACGFAVPPHKLSAKERPDIIQKWINGARGAKQRVPPITDPVAFAASWWRWWGLLQPAWRTTDNDGKWVISESYDGEWDDKLLHWGPNGLLSVVAALYFWGCAVTDSPRLKDEWETAVQDASWILEGLAIFHEKFKAKHR
ncbi:hypothetical protein C8R47DRAFT_1229557 [Mycena vitilis]|nr:hypothetical protein C8R47DRAFT_1229557 [Mycena vitilis]